MSSDVILMAYLYVDCVQICPVSFWLLTDIKHGYRKWSHAGLIYQDFLDHSVHPSTRQYPLRHSHPGKSDRCYHKRTHQGDPRRFCISIIFFSPFFYNHLFIYVREYVDNGVGTHCLYQGIQCRRDRHSFAFFFFSNRNQKMIMPDFVVSSPANRKQNKQTRLEKICFEGSDKFFRGFRPGKTQLSQVVQPQWADRCLEYLMVV